jgi:hypothetical protein
MFLSPNILPISDTVYMSEQSESEKLNDSSSGRSFERFQMPSIRIDYEESLGSPYEHKEMDIAMMKNKTNDPDLLAFYGLLELK